MSGTMVPGATFACQPGGKDLPRSRFNSRPGGSPLVTMSSRSEWIVSGFNALPRSACSSWPGGVSGHDVIEIRMDHIGIQFPAAVSLQLLAGRKCINKSFFLSRESVIKLHDLVCLRRVMLRQRVHRAAVAGKVSAVMISAFVGSVLRMGAPR